MAGIALHANDGCVRLVVMTSMYEQARNEFVSVGAHVIISWGTTDMVDGTGPDHPKGTLIESNLAREIGIWEKQTCFYVQALSEDATLRENIAFNSARAMINFNGGVLFVSSLFHQPECTSCGKPSA